MASSILLVLLQPQCRIMQCARKRQSAVFDEDREQDEDSDRESVVDARGAQAQPSSSSPPPPQQAALKTVWATRRQLNGNDYHCDDSDGTSPGACQIRCGAPCLEPFRLCMAHEPCHVVVLNHEGTFATLKTSLPGRALWFGATPCKNRKDWHAWLGKTVGGHELVVELAPLEAPQARFDALRFEARLVSLSLRNVAGQDFKCAESDGAVYSACQVKCESDDCVEAFRTCVANPRCAVVQMNAEWSWGTLKLAGGGAPLAAVHNETSWHSLYRAHQLAAAHVRRTSTAAAIGAAAAAGRGEERDPRRRAAAAGAARAAAADDAAAESADDAPSNATVALWEEALRSVARSRPPGADGAADEDDEEHASRRPVMLTLADVKHHDFSCPDLPDHLAGSSLAACQVKCEETSCLSAYRQCLARAHQCLAVHVNFERTWGTLKTSVQDGQEIVVVLSEAEWKVQLQSEEFHRRGGSKGPNGANRPYWLLAKSRMHASSPLRSLLGFT